MFQGFTKDAIDFLWDIRFHNEKSWFEENRDRFERVLRRPFVELAEEVTQWVADFDPTRSFRPRVSRIYKDMRYYHGGGPYQDHLWLCARVASEDWMEHLNFYFQLSPEAYGYGCGFFRPSAEQMNALRAKIDAAPEQYRLVRSTLTRLPGWKTMGAAYKRKFADKPDDIADWYARKDLFFAFERPVEDALFSRALFDRMFAEFAEFEPIYHYLSGLSGQAAALSGHTPPRI